MLQKYNTNSVKLYSPTDQRILELLETEPKGLLEFQISKKLDIPRDTTRRHLKKLTESAEIFVYEAKRKFYVKNSNFREAIKFHSIKAVRESKLPNLPKQLPITELNKALEKYYPNKKLTKLEAEVCNLKFRKYIKNLL